MSRRPTPTLWVLVLLTWLSAAFPAATLGYLLLVFLAALTLDPRDSRLWVLASVTTVVTLALVIVLFYGGKRLSKRRFSAGLKANGAAAFMLLAYYAYVHLSLPLPPELTLFAIFSVVLPSINSALIVALENRARKTRN